MFTPPRCPNPRCTNHRDPVGSWWRKRGSYQPRCRHLPVPRFDCKACDKGFSRQTFRADYWDRKPHVNAQLATLLSSGNGLRQSARMLHLHRNALMAKARKLGLQLLHAHHNQLRRLRLFSPTLVLDEMESFEGSRRTRPVTMPVLIDRDSMYVIGAGADTLAARGRLARRHRRVLERDQARDGKRKNRSSRATGHLLRIAARISEGPVTLVCDRKLSYPGLARRAFGEDRVEVQQHSSKLARNTANPLFRINLTNAMFRDLAGRLRRRSWLASKKRHCLRIALAFVICYRNYIRPRFNRDERAEVRTPAQLLSLVDRPLSFQQLLGWRQDWGPRSPALLAS